MDFHKTVLAVMLVMPVAAPVLAQSVGSEVQRDINQETRVEQGLKSGQLNTGEAARLERGEGRIDRMESKALNRWQSVAGRSGPHSACTESGVWRDQSVEAQRCYRQSQFGFLAAHARRCATKYQSAEPD
jgi:hypothetical protein